MFGTCMNLVLHFFLCTTQKIDSFQKYSETASVWGGEGGGEVESTPSLVHERFNVRHGLRCIQTYFSLPYFLLTVSVKHRQQTTHQTPVVQRLDNAIHRLSHYPADKC